MRAYPCVCVCDPVPRIGGTGRKASTIFVFMRPEAFTQWTPILIILFYRESCGKGVLGTIELIGQRGHIDERGY